ncbi:hypothetical protein BT67DRAFT_416608 [Trichocladium antarcticum]|uniref:Uncharacterized protein n=1 Tax=Trichocladium antarcticum TaxID=1450529 RepID=A0AAN6ZFJ6_9PEZI|nr:hypothetical protein BT67DRAFT_416608 [Trichocladium antarcticum]
MSQNGGDAFKASPPGRPRHQITRSISEISSPMRAHRRYSHRAIKQAHRDTHSPAAQSAISSSQGRRSFELSRSEGATPNITPNASRRTSILHTSAAEVMPVAKAPEDNAPVEESAKVQQMAEARECGLQRSLAELEIFANSATKQLDDTYYSVLTKLSTLQSTIPALEELAQLSSELNGNFSIDAEELVTDIGSQLDAFGHFEDQQKRIESLQSRIHAGRGLIRGLSERVDAVSGQIESWERADREWQEKTRKRLKAGWVVTSVVIFLVLALFVGAQYVPEGLEGSTARRASDGLNTLRGAAAAKADALWNSRDAERPETSNSPANTMTTESPSVAAEFIRAFDEL